MEKDWLKRSLKYGYKIEGVLPKSLPRLVNQYLDYWMYSIVKKNMPKNKNIQVLDLGCGYGRISEKLIRDFPSCSVSGVDISDYYVKLYNQKLKPKAAAYKANITKLPFKDQKFDLVFIIATLMYLTTRIEQEQAVREIFRVLKGGGNFVVIERNKTGNDIINLWGLVPFLRGKKYMEIKAVSFNKSTMIDLFSRQGDVKEVEGIPFWSLLLPFFIILGKTSKFFLSNLLILVSFLDKSRFSRLSLYVAFSGFKKSNQ